MSIIQRLLKRTKDLPRPEIDEDFLKAYSDNYGKPTSLLLEKVKSQGFKPIAITIMMCEETFVFETESEANKAANMFLPEGWWYELEQFQIEFDKYIQENYNSDYDKGPKVHWLNEKL